MPPVQMRPYDQGQGGMDSLQLYLLLNKLKADGGRQQATQEGSGKGLGDIVMGGAAGGGAASQSGLISGLFGGGSAGGGVGSAAAAEFGAPSMMMPELSLMGGEAAGVGAGGGAASGAAGLSSTAGFSPLLGVAGVAATPLIGKMLGRQLAGPSLRPRPYDANEMLQHNSLGQRFDGFDRASSETKKKVADILGHDAKGSDSLFSGTYLGGPTADYDFALPGVVNRNELADKMNRMKGGMGINQKGWGNKATAKSYFDGVSAREMYDAAEPMIMNKKMSGDIEGKLKAIEQLLSGKPQAPSAPAPKSKAPQKMTAPPRTVPEIAKQFPKGDIEFANKIQDGPYPKGDISHMFNPVKGMIPKGKWG